MDVNAEINWITQELLSINDPSLIERIKNMLLARRSEQEQSRISVEQYNQEVDEVVEQYKRGEYISQEELEQQVKKW